MNSVTCSTNALGSALRPLGLSVVVIILAAIEAFNGLSQAPILFGNMSEIPGPGVACAMIKAHLASHPLLALAALAFAAAGRLRYAIIALAVLILTNWLREMPSIVMHGFDLRGVAAFETPLRIIAFPLMAACAMALAARESRLGLATMLVSIPTLFGILAIIAFGISVAIHGF
jgi:hypothetical protein